MRATPSRGRPALGDEELLALARSLPEPPLTEERQEEMRTAFLSTVRGLRSGARLAARTVKRRRRLLLIGTAVLFAAAAAAAWRIGSSPRRQPPAQMPARIVAVEPTSEGSAAPTTPPPQVPEASPPAVLDRPVSTNHPRRVAFAPNRPAGALEGRESVEVAFARGWSALRTGDFNTAAEWFGRAISDQNGTLTEDALFWRGVALDRAGRFVMAREVVTDFLARYPNSDRSGEASVILGWLFVRSGEFNAAHQLFQGALEDPAERVRKSARAGLIAAERQSREAARAIPTGP